VFPTELLFMLVFVDFEHKINFFSLNSISTTRSVVFPFIRFFKDKFGSVVLFKTENSIIKVWVEFITLNCKDEPYWRERHTA